MKRCGKRSFAGVARISIWLCSGSLPVHAQEGLAPIPAAPPLSGPFWTVVVPLVLFGIAFAATLGLYRRFSRDGAETPRGDRE